MERIAAQLCLLTGFLQVLSLSKSIRFIQVVLVSDIPSLPSIHPSILPYFFDILPFDPGIMTQNSPPPPQGFITPLSSQEVFPSEYPRLGSSYGETYGCNSITNEPLPALLLCTLPFLLPLARINARCFICTNTLT